MYSSTNEAGPITYQFLSLAAHHFNTSENWQNDIRHLLEKLAVLTAASRISIQQFTVGSAQKKASYEVIQSWQKNNSTGLIPPFSPGNCKESKELLALLSNHQSIQIDTEDQASAWHDDLVTSGLESYTGLPVFSNNNLWGILGLEFSDSKKSFSKTELSILDSFSGLFGRAIEKEHLDRALRLDKSYFEELFHSSPAAIVILDQEGKVERINREFTRLFQYEPDEIIGHKIDEVLPSDYDKEGAVELTGRILEGERIALEGVRYRKDGDPVFVTIVAVQSLPKHEDPKVYTIYYDITDRVLAQEKLQESQARFKLLFESANDAIFLLKEGIVFECNARTLDVFRCTREEIIGKSAIDLSPRRQPSGVLSLNQAVKYNRAAQIQEAQSFEWLHKRPDGSQFVAEVSVNVFEWKDESFAQAIVRDISQRKQTEKLLQQRFEFIAFLSRASAELINLDSACIDTSINEVLAYSGTFSNCERALIYMLNPEGLHLQMTYRWNSEGTPPVEAMEQLLVTDLPGIYDKISKGETLICKALSSPTQSEDVLLAETLDLVNFRSYVIVPLTIAGKFIGLIAYFTGKETADWNDDVINPLKLTSQMIANAIERRKVEQELKTAKEKAVESDKLKTAFLSSMSHEIRTPMNHILGFIELLKDPGLSEKEKREFMTIVKSSGNLLLRLIDDIIDIAKLESGQLVINQVDIQLSKFVDDINLAFTEQLSSVGKGRIEFNVVKPVRPAAETIKTDPLRLHQIVSNLLSNALKFTQEGKIKFGYTIQKDNKLHFFIEDTGIGIPPEKHLEVFERFRQLDSSYAREFSGTGLGLSISKGLVELMNGEIGLESEPGKGSRFFFTIPYQPVSRVSDQIGVKLTTASEFNFAGKTVLIVEDDEINFRFLEIVINKTKAKVLRALTGREAIDISLQQDISLVLMDIQIPILDGYIATREIKKVKPELPIIAQTAHALAEEKTRCLDSGADEYLSKPINRRELLTKMAVFLNE